MTQLGIQPARFSFFLNPYPDMRFTACPRCRTKTRLRKVPLVIHVDPHHPFVLNKSCRYCDTCDLLIVHQDELEAQMVVFYATHVPEAVGNEYLVLGTFDRSDWQRGRQTPHTIQTMLDNLHDFREVLKFEIRQGWLPAE